MLRYAHLCGKYRFDTDDSGKPVLTEEGWLLIHAVVATSGILRYRNPDGSTTRELVLDSELSDPDSVASLDCKVVVREHPQEGDRFVRPDNHRKESVGDINNVRFDSGELWARFVIRDTSTIKAILAGKLPDVSAGYLRDVEETSGTHPKWGPYDVIQRKRRYNHAAVTKVGRNSRAKLRFDSAIDLYDTETSQMDPKILQLLALLGLSVTDPAQALVGGQELRTRLDSISDLEAAIETAAAAVATATAGEQARFDSYVEERLPLLKLAEKHEVKDAHKHSNEPLRKMVAIAARPKIRLDANDDYYKAAIEFLDLNTEDAPVTEVRETSWRLDANDNPFAKKKKAKGGKDNDDEDEDFDKKIFDTAEAARRKKLDL